MRRRSTTFAAIAMAIVSMAGCGTDSGGTPTAAPGPSLDLVTVGTLTVGSDMEYPPQEYYEPAGSTNATGFDVDIAKALADHMTLNGAVMVNHGFDTILDDLKLKKYDIVISAMTINDKRKKDAFFLPYFNAGEAFVVLKSGSYKPTKPADLCGHKVAVEAGTVEESEAKALPCKPTVLAFETDTKALAAVKSGAADVDFTDSPVAGYDAKKDPALIVPGPPFETGDEGIAIRLDDTALQDAVKKAFADMKADGSYQKILDKWGLSSGAVS